MAQVVVITGASSGFGYDSAVALAARGHHVFATMRDSSSRNAPARAALVQVAAREGRRLEVVELDVTRDDSVAGAIQQVLAKAGHIDVVVNNAGYAGLGVTEGYLPEQFQQMFDVNVFGVQRVNRAVLPSMRSRGRGVLIHVSSGGGRVVVPTMAAYCASKFALEALADAYRYELAPFGINSIVVEPGIYKTPIFDRLAGPGDRERAAAYAKHDFAERVAGVFKAVSGADDNPGTSEVVDALVRLIEMDDAARPFRTVVSAAIAPLLEPYNSAHEALRPIVAQIFNVPELADAAAAGAGRSTPA
jgi:NAD(P)-dependent dehydrogenase (short-subunit alcohol dehydrogenase family)